MKKRLSEIAQRAEASASEHMRDAGDAVRRVGTSVAEATGENLKYGAQRTIQALNDASNVIGQGARASIDATKSAVSSLGESTDEYMRDAGNAVRRVGTSVAEATGENLKYGALRTIQALNDASNVIGQGTRASIDATKSATSSLGKAASAAADTAGTAMAAVATTTKLTASTVATTVLDQNGDGKLDQEDVRILTEKGIKLAKSGSFEIKQAAKSIASSAIVKESAAAALVGAAITIPVPIVGPATGALIGGAWGAYAHITRRSIK